MSEHASGFFDTQLATTVAFLLQTSIEHAQRLVNDFRGIENADAQTLAVVADLIITSLNGEVLSDDVGTATMGSAVV